MFKKIFDFLFFSYVYYVDGEGGDMSGGGGESDGGSVSDTDTSSDTSEGDQNSNASEEVDPALSSEAAPEFSWDDHMDRPIKTKINGQEQEIPLARMIAEYQKAAAAEERFNMASQKEKQVMSIIEALKTNPADAISKLGLNPLEFATQYLENYIAESEESPEQKRLKELEAYKAQQEQQEKIRQQEIKKREEEAAVNAVKEQLENDIMISMDKHNLRKSEGTVKAIASYLQSAHMRNIDMTVDHAARLVKQDMRDTVLHTLKDLDGDAILHMMGDDIAEKIRKALLAKVANKSNKSVPVSGSKQLPKEAPKTLKEYNAWLREKEGL